MKLLTRQYKKYREGGQFQEFLNEGGMEAGLGLAGIGLSTAESIRGEQINEYGLAKPSVGLTAGKGALSGASAGMAAGPMGAAVGAVVGGAAGLIGGLAQKRQHERLTAQYAREKDRMLREQGAARIASDPSLVRGNLGANYFANGGQLQHLSSTAGEFQGPSHAQGGIQLPAHQAEVEGKETIDGGYVFSKQLGFDKLHRPMAKAMGRIEQKAPTPERIKSLDYLRRKTEALKQSQEFIKEQLQLT